MRDLSKDRSPSPSRRLCGRARHTKPVTTQGSSCPYFGARTRIRHSQLCCLPKVSTCLIPAKGTPQRRQIPRLTLRTGGSTGKVRFDPGFTSMRSLSLSLKSCPYRTPTTLLRHTHPGPFSSPSHTCTTLPACHRSRSADPGGRSRACRCRCRCQWHVRRVSLCVAGGPAGVSKLSRQVWHRDQGRAAHCRRGS